MPILKLGFRDGRTEKRTVQSDSEALDLGRKFEAQGIRVRVIDDFGHTEKLGDLEHRGELARQSVSVRAVSRYP